MLGDLVFVSSFDRRTTYALGANTGRTLWKWKRGAFNPAISDGRRIYFNGYGTLYGLDPKGLHFSRREVPRGTPARRVLARKKRQAAKREGAARPKPSAAARKRAASAAKRRKAQRARAAAKRRYCRSHKRAKRCR